MSRLINRSVFRWGTQGTLIFCQDKFYCTWQKAEFCPICPFSPLQCSLFARSFNVSDLNEDIWQQLRAVQLFENFAFSWLCGCDVCCRMSCLGRRFFLLICLFLLIIYWRILRSAVLLVFCGSPSVLLVLPAELAQKHSSCSIVFVHVFYSSGSKLCLRSDIDSGFFLFCFCFGHVHVLDGSETMKTASVKLYICSGLSVALK